MVRKWDVWTGDFRSEAVTSADSSRTHYRCDGRGGVMENPAAGKETQKS